MAALPLRLEFSSLTRDLKTLPNPIKLGIVLHSQDVANVFVLSDIRILDFNRDPYKYGFQHALLPLARSIIDDITVQFVQNPTTASLIVHIRAEDWKRV